MCSVLQTAAKNTLTNNPIFTQFVSLIFTACTYHRHTEIMGYLKHGASIFQILIILDTAQGNFFMSLPLTTLGIG